MVNRPGPSALLLCGAAFSATGRQYCRFEMELEPDVQEIIKTAERAVFFIGKSRVALRPTENAPKISLNLT